MVKYLVSIPKRKFPVRVSRKHVVTKVNNSDLAVYIEIRLGGTFKPLLNTDCNLEELYEKIVSVTNKTSESTNKISFLVQKEKSQFWFFQKCVL